MENSADFERAIRARYSITSDYQLSKLLHVTTSAVSARKRGHSKTFGEETGQRIAELLGLEPAYVLACLAAERAKRPDVRATWERIAATLTRTAAAFLLGIALFSPPTPSQASTATGYTLCEAMGRAKRLASLLVRLRRFLAYKGLPVY